MFLFIVAIQHGEDHLHLASLKNAQKAVCEDLSVQTVNKQCVEEPCASTYIDSSGCEPTREIGDSEKDSDFSPGACEMKGCKEEVWAACHDCEILVCYAHCNEDSAPCDQHEKILKKKKKSK